MDMHRAHLCYWVFGHPKKFAPQFHALFYYTLLLNISDPILLPFRILMSVEKAKILSCFIIAFRLEGSKNFDFLLGLKDGGNFDLRPYEVGILVFIC